MKKKIASKALSQLVKLELKREVNGFCHYFLYQPKLPAGLKDWTKNK